MKHVRKKSQYLKPKFFIFAGIYLIIIILFIGLALSNRNRAVSDQERMEDLSRIEQAINDRINNAPNSEARMPRTLNDLKLFGLNGKINDYDYKNAKATYFGGDYDLCATFESDGEPYSFGTVGGYGADNYKTHHKGFQCFSNSVYKGGSHIQPI